MTKEKIKVAVIGGGNVGAAVVHYVAKRIPSVCLNGEIVFLDVIPRLAEQKALDFDCAKTCYDYRVQFTGGTDFSLIRNADVVVHTAGVTRKPGMDRMDLLKTNVAIAKDISKSIVKYAPKAILIVVANPLDVIATVCYRETKFPKRRVIGMAGVLDSARCKYFVSEKLNIAAAQVQTMVLGGHGDTMVPITQYSAVSGVSLLDLIDINLVRSMEMRTRVGGSEIVKHLKVGSAYYAPAASAADMVEAIITGEKRIIPASVYVQGEYGAKNIFLGVPIILGSKGVERIVEIPLNEEQSAALKKSADMVRKGLESLERF